MSAKKTTTKMGRPRGFDEDAALDAAMRVFWERGYEGAKLAELEAAMGINRSSTFAAFGNKETLFKRAFERYANKQLSHVQEAFAKPTIREMVEFSLRSTVDYLTRPDSPDGCLSVHAALATGPDGEPIKDYMNRWKKQGELFLKKRFEQAQKDGEFDKSIDAAGYSRLLSTLIQGLGVQAASGATKAEMSKMVDVALHFMGY